MMFRNGIRQLARWIRGSPDLLAMYAAAATGMLRVRRNFVVQTYPGQRSLAGATRVAVIAHYDRCGRIHDYLVYYLESLRCAGFEIVFASNAPKLNTGGLARIKPHCALILRRKNVGYDFGAYKDSLTELGDLSRFDEVILANDSVYGPIFDLNATLLGCDDSADVWGMTDSQERNYHLQSYFLLLKRSALTSRYMIAFWQAVRPVQSRAWVIQRYEIGLTRAALLGGLRCAALFPYRIVAAACPSAPRNMMHNYWQQSIRLGCPFIKRELLLTNPWKVEDIDCWRDVIGAVSNYNVNLVVGHLQAKCPRRSLQSSGVINGHQPSHR